MVILVMYTSVSLALLIISIHLHLCYLNSLCYKIRTEQLVPTPKTKCQQNGNLVFGVARISVLTHCHCLVAMSDHHNR